jgi:subtilase family serine protease
MFRRTALFLLTLVAMLSVAATNSQAQDTLTRHVRDVTRTGEARPVGRFSANRTLQLDIVLPLRDQAGLDLLLQQIYDPADAHYRQFLTVPEFTERFGPTQVDYDAVVSWATRNGFAVVGGSRDGMDVQVRGRVSDIETAFHVSMRTYQHPTENRTFYAPDREPTTDLPFSLWHVSGLDNYSIPHPMLSNRNTYAAAHGMDPADVVSHATTGSGPSASYLGSDMRAAYYGSTALTGAGQNLGLLEYVGTDLADLTTYYHNVGQANTVPITLLSTDGTPTACVNNAGGGFCDDTEQTLDMTQALGMAPGLASLVVYVGSSDTAMISAMTTHNPLPTTIGCSWGWTPADPTILDPFFKKMAVQGQNFLTASGDNSTWTKFGNSAAWPADDPYVVTVGGTDLVTASAAGPWKSETAWANSGGGISPDAVAIPAWQQLSGVINSSNKGSTTLRNGPDVSANANFTFYVCADQTTCSANLYGGTSFAAPMWAGYLALVNQQLAASSSPTIGFINPTIYAQNITSQYATDFHDITSGVSGSFSAVAGYDLVTGWGSPNGANLINALAPTTPTFTVSASPSSVSVVRGNSGSSTITVGVLGGFSSAVALSATGQPTGVTVSFTPPSIAAPGSGTSSMSMVVASTTATGTYPITVTGTGGSVTQTTTVTLTVTAPGPSLTSISPSAGSQGSSVPVTLTGTGFVAPLTVNVSGSGITVSNVSVVSSTQATATLAIATSAGVGLHNVSVTTTAGTSGTTPFTVNAAGGLPTLTSVLPSSGALGTSVNVTLTGTNFTSASQVRLAGSGLSQTNIVVVSSTQITATYNISSSAATGAHNTWVVTGAGSSNMLTFTVTATGSAPTLTSVTPNSGVQGTAVPVTLAGTNFIAGATVAATGSGITVSNVAVVSGTQITATLNLAANATLGASNISVTTSGGVSNTSPFTVTGSAAVPTLTSVTPNSGTKGTAVNVTLAGSGFIAGATVGVSGSGITVSNVAVVSGTQITATLTIAAGATPGGYNVSVSTSGGTSNTAAFTVNGASGLPTLTTVTPSSGSRGTSVSVTLTGTNFTSASQVRLAGSGLTQTNIVVVSPTQITATYNISSSAQTGPHNTWIVTSAGSSNMLTFTVN